MADSKLTALSEVSAPALTDIMYYVADPAGTPASDKVTLARLGGVWPFVPGGRLTTQSGVAISTSDRTSQGTIYYTPYLHGGIRIYDGTRWKLYSFTEKSLSLTATSGKNYDVFIYDNSGTLTLELSAAWTDDTTRADALTTQDGVYVKSGATTRLWIGTIRASGTNVTEDSAAKRFVWNAYNQVQRPMAALTAAASWTYATQATWRAMDNDTALRLQWVCGLAGSLVDAAASVVVGGLTINDSAEISIGLDSTSSPTATQLFAYLYYIQTANGFLTTKYQGFSALGFHYLQALERIGSTAGTITFIGTQTEATSGIIGSIAG